MEAAENATRIVAPLSPIARHVRSPVPPITRDPPRACRKEEAAMTTSTAREPLRAIRSAASLPSPAEVDAMLQAVNVQLIQNETAPEPGLSPEAAWTLASLAAGAGAGCLGGGLIIGGWLAALAGSILGSVLGGVFAVVLWRASDGGAAFSPRKTPAYDPATDDLLSGW